VSRSINRRAPLDTRPTTLQGIRTLARRLQRANAIPEATALDRAAGQAGYSNWRHAQAMLAPIGSAA
jgi:hypothetical protein